ncbi:MAG: inorganic phosphate transporter, PiT family [Sphingomonadales bacterium]|nr:inorganic phosphate transporter, PiT family [Sphingomonadales bacterium]
MHELALPLLIGLILVALAFDFLNGLHDAANSIATAVATRLLRPVPAVAFAAFFNFAAYFLSLAFPSLHKVADTIGKGLIDKDLVTPAVVFGALIGAMFWNVVTWLKGIPSSSSHALVGGLIGAGVAHAGLTGVQWTGLNKTLIAIVLSPVLGMMLAMLIMLATSWLAVRASARGAERNFRALHLVSAAAYSIGHGLNDAQKTMGIITVLLYSTGYLSGKFGVPHWVAISCYIAMGLGTLSGGWGSSGRWARASPSSRSIRASALRPAVRSCCSPPPGSDSRSPPPTRSPAASSARASPGGPRQCAGESPRTSSWPGSSPSPPRPPSERSSTGSRPCSRAAQRSYDPARSVLCRCVIRFNFSPIAQ